MIAKCYILAVSLVISLSVGFNGEPRYYTALAEDDNLRHFEAPCEVLAIQEIPLPIELQYVAFNACRTFNVPFPLLFAVMERESDFNVNESNGVCFGLMQIHKQNFDWLEEILKGYGVTDIKNNPGDNIFAGAYLIGEYLNRYQDIHKALMAYNCGEYGAKLLWDKGIFQTSYSRKVEESLKKMEQFFGSGD